MRPIVGRAACLTQSISACPVGDHALLVGSCNGGSRAAPT